MARDSPFQVDAGEHKKNTREVNRNTVGILHSFYPQGSSDRCNRKTDDHSRSAARMLHRVEANLVRTARIIRAARWVGLSWPGSVWRDGNTEARKLSVLTLSFRTFFRSYGIRPVRSVSATTNGQADPFNSRRETWSIATFQSPWRIPWLTGTSPARSRERRRFQTVALHRSR